MLPKITGGSYSGYGTYFEVKAFELDPRGELRRVTKVIPHNPLKEMLEGLVKNEYVVDCIISSIKVDLYDRPDIYQDMSFSKDKFLTMTDYEKVEMIFKALRHVMLNWNPLRSNGFLQRLIDFLLKQWFGAKSSTVFGKYFLKSSSTSIDSHPLDLTTPASSTLPPDVLGLIFSSVSSPAKAMSLNMTTKGGVVKYPDYYKYIELFPYHVFKWALDDLIKSRMEKDISLYLTIMQRALYIDSTVFHIWADHIAANKDIDDALFKRITEMMIFECQFTRPMSSFADRAWSGGRKEYTRSLYERGIIDKGAFNKAAVDYIPLKEIPASYDRIVGNIGEAERVFKTSDSSSYDFLEGIATGKFALKLFLTEGVDIMLSAARRGYIKVKMENKTEEDPNYTPSEFYESYDYTREMEVLLKLKQLSPEDRKFIHSFVVSSPIRDYILLDKPIEDVIDNNNNFTCFAILQLGLDPRLYPIRFSSPAIWSNRVIKILPLMPFTSKRYLNSHDNVYYRLSTDGSRIETFYRWGNMFYHCEILDDRDVCYYHRVRFLNTLLPGVSEYLANDYMTHIFYEQRPLNPAIVEEYKKYIMREIDYLVEIKNPIVYERRYGLPGYLLPRIGDLD